MEESLFRSRDMSMIQLYIPYELAHSTVSELGELGLVQFRDLNPDISSFQRTYVNEIRRLDEMDRKIRFLMSHCRKANVRVKPIDASISYGRARTIKEIDELEASLNELEIRVTQMDASLLTLNRRFLELTEMRYVLREAATFFDEAESRRDAAVPYEEQGLLVRRNSDLESSSPTGKQAVLSFVAGIIPRSRMATFEKVLWRALRGNLYMNHTPIEDPIQDPVSEENILKNVFVVFAHGQEVLGKIRKISESLGATIYPIDSSARKRSEDALEVSARIEDLASVIYNTNSTRNAELGRVAEVIDQWLVFVQKGKGTYHTMNLFNYDSTRKCLIAEGWCPTNAISSVQYSLHSVSERSGSMVPPILNRLQTNLTPPTSMKTNKFTKGFQSIVDAYGYAKYKEVNPGIFTIISFPFLFAVMFGDIGHGTFLVLLALYFIRSERKFTSPGHGEMIKMIFGGRFLLLLMGIFSVYTGLIYNDIFSLPLSTAPSMWQLKETESGLKYIRDPSVGVYPFGVDYTWHLAENSLLFLNSYKMKMSILLGVLQMCFGIVLTLLNSRYFKKPINIYCEFIPQIIFMLSIFGYLCFMIILKWLKTWPNDDAPGLMNTLIYMFLHLGSVEEKRKLFAGQQILQPILLILAVICVPWLLLIKPLYLRAQHKRSSSAGYSVMLGGNSPGNQSTSSSGSPNHGHGADGGHEEFEFGEVMVHQVIHTIEFCLGCISNTASYLRLWALSLAHAQLSEVLWDMAIRSTMSSVAIIIGYPIWFALTLAILIGMEGLSAFLHALRLHWVEFNNKFYEASGSPFEPFSFVSILEEFGEQS